MLPAFGEFTGIVPVKPEAGDGVYAVADNYVVTVQPLADHSTQVKNKKHFMRS
jgi:hypothetical protein